jgi:hypothetical protein
MNYEIKKRTWTCKNGHINSLSNTFCPICKENEFKEKLKLYNIKKKKQYIYEKKDKEKTV